MKLNKNNDTLFIETKNGNLILSEKEILSQHGDNILFREILLSFFQEYDKAGCMKKRIISKKLKTLKVKFVQQYNATYNCTDSTIEIKNNGCIRL